MLFDTVQELIWHYLATQIDIDRYRIDMGVRGVKMYKSIKDIPKQELCLKPFWHDFRGYRDECGIRCRELEVWCD